MLAAIGAVGDLGDQGFALSHHALPEAGGDFAHGHPRATGGSLEPAEFERLLDGLGLGRT